MSRRFLVGALAIVIAIVVPDSAASGQPTGAFGYEAWKTQVSARGLDPAEVVYPFTASAEMVEWAETATAEASRFDPLKRLARLQTAIFQGETFDFAYDDRQTLTAQAAFESRRGNCMSFTALFIALSRSLGAETFLMAVQRQPDIDRDDGLVIVNRHVVAGFRSGGQVSIYDFYLSSSAPLLSQVVVDDVQASAMYHNNLGAAAIREGDHDRALRDTEIATVLAPEWSAGWVNNGVARARGGDVEGAFDAYRRALEVDPGNSSAFNNMSYIHKMQGREAEAQVALRAAAQKGNNPFTLVALADSEILRGDTREAKKLLKRAKRHYPREPEIYEGLARLARRTGHERREERLRSKAEKLRRKAETQP